MSHTIRVADDVYAHLTRLKREQNVSYSEVLRRLISHFRASPCAGYP